MYSTYCTENSVQHEQYERAPNFSSIISKVEKFPTGIIKDSIRNFPDMNFSLWIGKFWETFWLHGVTVRLLWLAHSPFPQPRTTNQKEAYIFRQPIRMEKRSHGVIIRLLWLAHSPFPPPEQSIRKKHI